MAKESADKQTITVTINGKNQPFTEKVAINDWQATKNEVAAAAEKFEEEEEEFDWVLSEKEAITVPEFQRIIYTPELNRPPSARRMKADWMKGNGAIVLSVFLAIAVGLGIGLFILKLVMPTDGLEAVDSASISTPDPVAVKEGEATATLQSVELPVLQTAVIQAGVFSTMAAGEEMASSFKSKGHAAVLIEKEGKFYLFTGVANDIATAKSYETALKTAGEDVWAKENAFPGFELKLADAQGDSLLKETSLFLLLAEETAKGLISGKMDAESLSKISQQLQSEEAKGYKDETAVKLHEKLVSALESANAFQAGGGKISLIEAQQHLLEYAGVYQKSASKP